MTKTRKNPTPAIFAVILTAMLLFAFGCSNREPKLDSSITPAPPPTDIPTPTQEPSPTPAATKAPVDGSGIDALGEPIYGTDHFQQYLQFTNIRTYEENGDTFVDCYVSNSYPEVLLCAVNIRFFDENGEVIATGSLQMPDGSFMLRLQNGDTPLYAVVLTDMSLIDKEFELYFDTDTGVNPE